MPYKCTKVRGGYKVTTPNTPASSGGFSKKPKSRADCEKQKSAIIHNAGPESFERRLDAILDSPNFTSDTLQNYPAQPNT